MKPSPRNLVASIRQRLLNKARETGRPFNEMLQYFAIERFLYRLSQSPHSRRFVLKGALMFHVWKEPFSRPTMDIDFLGRIDNSVERIVAVTREVCTQKVTPDGIVFDPATIEGERIAEEADYAGVRIRFRGRLGTARVVMQIDVGFGDVVFPATKSAEYPAILDLPAPLLSGYSRESTVAEKFEAMVKLGLLNSRMKDFFDIWVLSRQFNFDGQTLATAVKKTFSNRGTQIPSHPVALDNAFVEEPSKATQWRGFVRKSRLQDVPATLDRIVSSVAAFLGPVANALAAGKSFEGVWPCPGPWGEQGAKDV